MVDCCRCCVFKFVAVDKNLDSMQFSLNLMTFYIKSYVMLKKMNLEHSFWDNSILCTFSQEHLESIQAKITFYICWNVLWLWQYFCCFWSLQVETTWKYIYCQHPLKRTYNLYDGLCSHLLWQIWFCYGSFRLYFSIEKKQR